MRSDIFTAGCCAIISGFYGYQPSVLHAKMAIVDGKKLTIGSYNINNISKFVSIELNLDVNSCGLRKGE